MCDKTDSLIAATLRINSPYENIGHLIPKIIYPADDSISGIFYDPDRDQLIHADIKNGEILDQFDVVPTHIERPDETGRYAHSDDELMALHDCSFCGEADDLSCYVYFDTVDANNE